MQPIRWTEHWEGIRRHKLFVILVLVFGPLLGQAVASDGGLLFGSAVSIIAVVWLWGEGPRLDHR